jgi:hypothetical protein
MSKRERGRVDSPRDDGDRHQHVEPAAAVAQPRDAHGDTERECWQGESNCARRHLVQPRKRGCAQAEDRALVAFQSSFLPQVER